MADQGLAEITGFEELPGQEGPVSVVIPMVEEEGGGEGLGRVEIGDDLALTGSVAETLGAQLGMEAGDLRTRLAERLEIEVGELVGEAEQTGFQPVDVWRAALQEDYGMPSSLVRGADRWRVTEIAEGPDQSARVSFGRGSLRELAVSVDADVASGLERGTPIVGPERLWFGGRLRLGRAEVEFVPDPDPPDPIEIWVPVMRLHRPRHEGCEVTYTAENTNADTIDAEVKIFGMGAGGGFSAKVSVKDGYTAKGDCVETVVPAQLQMLPGKTVVNGTEVAYGMRAKVFNAEPDRERTRAIPMPFDCCERSRTELDGLAVKPFGLADAPPDDIRTNEVTLETETHGRLAVGLETGGSVPVKMGLDYERSTVQKTAIQVVLAAGVDYLAYAPFRHVAEALEQQIEICWTTRA